MVWPGPERANVTLDLARCQLNVPVRRVVDEPAPRNPGPPQFFPQLEAEVLRAPVGTSERRVEEDGVVVLETFDDYGKTRDPYHGVIAGSDVRMRYAIHPDDPASARFFEAWHFSFERGDWQVEIETGNTMTSDREKFYLHRKLVATEGAEKAEVLRKEWSQTVARGLL